MYLHFIFELTDTYVYYGIIMKLIISVNKQIDGRCLAEYTTVNVGFLKVIYA